jgi:hypothetical protein
VPRPVASSPNWSKQSILLTPDGEPSVRASMTHAAWLEYADEHNMCTFCEYDDVSCWYHDCPGWPQLCGRCYHHEGACWE